MSKTKSKEQIKKSLYAKQVKETGERLYHLREKEELSCSKLINQLASEQKNGAQVKISKTQYTRYENGECFMNTETLMALCQFYNVSTDYISRGVNCYDNNKTKFFNKANDVSACKLLEYLAKIFRIKFGIT